MNWFAILECRHHDANHWSVGSVDSVITGCAWSVLCMSVSGMTECIRFSGQLNCDLRKLFVGRVPSQDSCPDTLWCPLCCALFCVGQWVYVWRQDLRGARDPTVGPALSRWVGPGLVALQDGTMVWVSMRGRLWKCAREQNREATSHESSGAELLTHDHLRQLLMGRPFTANPD